MYIFFVKGSCEKTLRFLIVLYLFRRRSHGIPPSSNIFLALHTRSSCPSSATTRRFGVFAAKMFADENAPFSFGSTDFFTGTEPRKSVGGTGRLSDTFGSDELPLASQNFGGSAESLSQEHLQSQRGVPSSSSNPNQAGDACVCVTISLLKKALKARGETPAGSRGSGVLRIHEKDAALVGLCGWVAAVEVRPSLVRLVLQDGTGQLDVECSHSAALAGAAGDCTGDDLPNSESPWSVNSVIQVYGVACADDSGVPFVDACKISKVTDMRLYFELFPMKVIAAALAGTHGRNSGNSSAIHGVEGIQEPEGRRSPAYVSRVIACILVLVHVAFVRLRIKAFQSNDFNSVWHSVDQEMSRYIHIHDASQRAVLKALLRDASHTIKREEIPILARISSKSSPPSCALRIVLYDVD